MKSDDTFDDDEVVGGENHVHAALFAHVGVSDPTDWRGVALALARRYAPHVLTGEVPSTPVRKKPGRPEKWDPLAKAILLAAIDEIQADAREGRIMRNLATIEAACAYLLNDAQAAPLREKCSFFMPVDGTVENLRNVVSRARREQP